MYIIYLMHKVPNQHIIRSACTEQAMPNPTSPRVGQLPKGAGARLAGLNKLFFLGPDFWWISVNGSLAQVTASARIAQTGSNMARWFYLLHCARDARVCWNRTNIFWFMVCQKWRPKPIFPLVIYWDSFELARTDINTQGRQESAVGVVSAVSACHCETVLDSTG